MNHALETVLVEQVFAMARVLLAGAEPVKAYWFLTEGAPQAAIEHPSVRAFAERIRSKTDHAWDDDRYLQRYSVDFADLYDLETPPVPFGDQGVLKLDRSLRTRHAISKFGDAPFAALAIGAGDCSTEREMLRERPGMTLDVSELNDTASEAVKALQDLYPNRVKAVGRYDAGTPTPAQYDVIWCLEVLEHVADPVKLLENLTRALKPAGTLLLSTPNHEEWVESVHLERLGHPAWWYQHLRAYTPKTLVADYLKVGLIPTIVNCQRSLYTSASVKPFTSGEPVERIVQQWSDALMARAKALPPGSVVYSNHPVGAPEAPVVCINGVVLAQGRHAPLDTPVLS